MAQRLLKEYKEVQKNKEADLALKPDENNIFNWYAKIVGPADTAYANGTLANFIIVSC